LAADSLCPIQDKAGDWRRGGSDKILEDGNRPFILQPLF